MEKISAPRIILHTFLLAWQNKHRFSRALAFPVFLLVSIWAVWQTSSPLNTSLSWLFYGVYFMAFAWLAIICHRLVLAEPGTLRHILLPQASLFMRFVIFMVAVYALMAFAKFLTLNLYLFVFHSSLSIGAHTEEPNPNNQNLGQDIEMTEYVGYLVSMYIAARFCLIFPATALGYKTGLKWSWQATRDNQWSIFFIIALFPWALQLGIYALYRDQPTMAEQVILTLLLYICFALGIIAVSLTYKELYRIRQQHN